MQLFSQNTAYHTDAYNSEFSSLMYSSICDNLDFLGPYPITLDNVTGLITPTFISRDDCEAFNLGILKKGLYSTITKYLSSLKQIDSQFQLLRLPN